MKDTDYAFAVAEVRQLENTLFDKQQMASLINAKTNEDIKSLLSLKGFEIPENADIREVLDNESKRNYEFAKEILSDDGYLEIFTVKNDFHNLKAAVKALMCGANAEQYYVFPTQVDCDTLTDDIANKNFGELPEYMREVAKTVYDTTAESRDGQMIDVIIDRETLGTISKLSKRSGSELMKEYGELTVNTADIKTAYRGAKAGKNEAFFEYALCGSEALPKIPLCRAAAKGTDEVLNFVAQSGETELFEALKQGVSALEKCADAKTAEIMSKSAFEAFGPDPIIAFYWLREMQIRNIRIITVCREMRLEPQKIAERVRDIYV